MSALVAAASTVVLLRDGTDGVETWLLSRVAKMAFAPGATVFPGGRAEAADADLPWSGRPASVFATEFGTDEVTARMLVGAAVREVFEETGVLLTVPGADAAHAQPEVEAGRLAFVELLAKHELRLDADALRPWGRWITPEGQTRRYDTHFFVAALPVGAVAADLTTESTVAAWLRPSEALARLDRRELAMLPPTIAVLRSISELSSVAEVLAAAAEQPLAPSRARVRNVDGRVEAVLPDGTVVVMG